MEELICHNLRQFNTFVEWFAQHPVEAKQIWNDYITRVNIDNSILRIFDWEDDAAEDLLLGTSYYGSD